MAAARRGTRHDSGARGSVRTDSGAGKRREEKISTTADQGDMGGTRDVARTRSAIRRSGQRRATRENGTHERETDNPMMSAEHDSLLLFLWPHIRATRHTITPTPDIPPGPGRAREATLRAGARGNSLRHVVSPTAPAPFAEVRARVAKRPEKRSLWSVGCETLTIQFSSVRTACDVGGRARGVTVEIGGSEDF